MELPTGVVKAKSVNPATMLIYSNPKLGKSTIMAGLTLHESNSLIISTEPNGYNFLDAIVVEALTAKEFRDVINAVKERNKEKRLKYLVIDTITKLDEWSEIVGTLRYMETSQGKKFNRVNKVAGGPKIPPSSTNFETVHDIPQGYGYKHSRAVMVDWFEQLSNLADHVIFVAHVKDKLVSSTLGETITSTTINLTGKVKDIYCARVDSIAMLIPGEAESERYLSFQAKDDVKFMGSRAAHLKGKLLISTEKDEVVTTHWDNIFI